MSFMLLPEENYLSIQHLCAPLDMHLAVAAILAGETPAQIYVDDLTHPSLALLFRWDNFRLFLAGEMHDEQVIPEIRRLLFSVLASTHDEVATPMHEFLLYYASPGWEASMPLLCQGMETFKLMRQYYVMTPPLSTTRMPLPAQWTLREVDAALLADHSLQHLPQLVEEIHSESPSTEDFFARKFGFCVQEGTALLGWCLSEYNHGDRCEVGIETLAAYRRQSVAHHTASALLAHAMSVGITQVGWHCLASNVPSRSLALKLGGVLAAEYAVQLCRFTMSPAPVDEN